MVTTACAAVAMTTGVDPTAIYALSRMRTAHTRLTTHPSTLTARVHRAWAPGREARVKCALSSLTTARRTLSSRPSFAFARALTFLSPKRASSPLTIA